MHTCTNKMLMHDVTIVGGDLSHGSKFAVHHWWDHCKTTLFVLNSLAVGKWINIVMMCLTPTMCPSFSFFLSSCQPLGGYPRYSVPTEISWGKFFLVHFPSHLFTLPCSVSFYASSSFTLLSSVTTHHPPWACVYVCLCWTSPEPLADEFP